MYFDRDQVVEQFSNFTTIYQTVTSNQYSIEDQQEMMQLLKTQTVEKHLDVIHLFRNLKKDIDELTDMVLRGVNESRIGDFRSQELFLSFFDEAMNQQSKSIGQSTEDSVHHTNTNQGDSGVEILKKRNENLISEVKLLKEELDEKYLINDSIKEEADRKINSLKADLLKQTENQLFLKDENISLKMEIVKLKSAMDRNMKETRKGNEKNNVTIAELKLELEQAKRQVQELESDRDLMNNELNLLREEIFEKDLLLKSLTFGGSEGKLESNKESKTCPNLSFMLRTPGTEAGRRRRSSFYRPGITTPLTLRSKELASIVFDDSMASLPPEWEELTKVGLGGNIGDELMETRRDLKEERTRVEISRLLDLVTAVKVELHQRREELEASVKLLIRKMQVSQSKHLKTRYRVVDGKVNKMVFFKYEGIRVT